MTRRNDSLMVIDILTLEKEVRKASRSELKGLAKLVCEMQVRNHDGWWKAEFDLESLHLTLVHRLQSVKDEATIRQLEYAIRHTARLYGGAHFRWNKAKG